MIDLIGDRMKERYEDRTRYMLPRRTYTIVRLDGVAFHSYCKNLLRPYDSGMAESIDWAARVVLKNIQGCAFAYTQSDEISILLTDFRKPDTDACFDGNLQKIVSVTSGAVSVAFNAFAGALIPVETRNVATVGIFDSRAFTIPDYVEVENYFIWRQKDAVKNSIQGLARSLYSHKQLHKVSIANQLKMIKEAGQDWADYPERFKRGGLITRTAIHTAPNFCSKEGRRLLQSFIPQIWADDKEANAQQTPSAS